MVSLLFAAIAAALWAVMDRVENEGAIATSIFTRWKNRAFYYTFISKRESWDKCKKLFGSYPLNLWHICKTAAIGAFFMAAILFEPLLPRFYFEVLGREVYYFDLAALCVAFILTFNLFYNQILKNGNN